MSEQIINSEVSQVDERIPMGRLSLLGLQHVLAIYAGAIATPIIIGQALNLSPEKIAFLISADLLTVGLATILQGVGILNFSGIKLPVVVGVTFTAVIPIIAIGSAHGLNAAFTSVVVGGLFAILFAPIYGKILRFFPSVVLGSILTIIGFSLIPVAMENIAGGAGSPGFGANSNLFLALFVIFLIIIINRFLSGFLQAIAILLGLLAGVVLAYFLGMVDFTQVSNANWISIVKPWAFGPPKFVLSGALTMCLVYLVSMVESTGVYFGVGDIVGKKITEKDIVKGLRAEGIAGVIGGMFNCFSYSTYSQNMGIVTLSGVKSRWVTVAAGVICMILGTIPKCAAMANVIPPPVLGGAMLVMFGTVGASGIRIISKSDLSVNSNLLVVACSIGVGLGVAVVPGVFDKAPEIVKMLIGNGIVSGTLTAVGLNLFLNWKSLMHTNSDINDNLGSEA